MPHQIFINLPVRRLDKSIAFFKALGFKLNKQFTDDTAACMVISEGIYAMLLTHAKFRQFTSKDIADTRKAIEMLTALSVGSKAAVGRLVDKAIANGGREPRPAQDMGFMYLRTFEDLDGHTWEIFWMDPKTVKKT